MNEGMKVSENMKVRMKQKLKPHYLVVNIGGKYLSTTKGDMSGIDFQEANLQISTTKNIGDENNLWITGNFTYTNGHQKIEKVHFELNFYSDIKW